MWRFALGALVAGGLVAGCAPVRPAPAPAAAAALAPTGVRVHLVWAGPADLDLLVTDPGGRTYSVEHPGDVIAGDAGCERAEGVAVETASWAAPPSGRYRVGVDFPQACAATDAVPYRVVVDVAGARRVVDGTATPLQRTPNAVEFVVP
jgi:hypothetical protein